MREYTVPYAGLRYSAVYLFVLRPEPGSGVTPLPNAPIKSKRYTLEVSNSGYGRLVALCTPDLEIYHHHAPRKKKDKIMIKNRK